jgi:hypothetical protein
MIKKKLFNYINWFHNVFKDIYSKQYLIKKHYPIMIRKALTRGVIRGIKKI